MTFVQRRISASEGRQVFPCQPLLLAAAAIALWGALAPALAQTPSTPAVGSSPAAVPCSYAAEIARFDQPLARTAARLNAGQPVKIVAIGSSSTAGAGASNPAASYPGRLAVELVRRLQTESVTVINRGVNGEEAQDMMARFPSEIIPEQPDLVLWQVGTNSLLRDRFTNATESLIHSGILQLKATGADVVLMDAQYAPRVLAKAHAREMVQRLAEIAKAANIQVFRRFELMQHWHQVNRVSFDVFVSSDGLHMNDWSYACVARALGAAIADAVARPVATAVARPPR